MFLLFVVSLAVFSDAGQCDVFLKKKKKIIRGVATGATMSPWQVQQCRTPLKFGAI